MQSEIVKMLDCRMSNDPRVFGEDVHPCVGVSVELLLIQGHLRHRKHDHSNSPLPRKGRIIDRKGVGYCIARLL
jgi:hypothetical protein